MSLRARRTYFEYADNLHVPAALWSVLHAPEANIPLSRHLLRARRAVSVVVYACVPYVVEAAATTW